MSTLEFHDEIGDDDDSPSLAIETTSYREQHRRPWWKSSMGMMLLLAVIVAIIVGLSHDGSNSKSSSASELSAPQPQQDEDEPQASSLSSFPTSAPGMRGSTTTSPTSSTGTGIVGGSPSAAPTKTCVQEQFETCLTNRIGHDTPLLAGQALCNHQYQFGITKGGSFQWYDCNQEITRVIYQNSTVSYFSMSQTGAFRLVDQNNHTIWRKRPNVHITFTKECFQDPLLDCPFLQVHRDGVVVLKSMDNSTGEWKWSDLNVGKVFDNLFQA